MYIKCVFAPYFSTPGGSDVMMKRQNVSSAESRKDQLLSFTASLCQQTDVTSLGQDVDENNNSTNALTADKPSIHTFTQANYTILIQHCTQFRLKQGNYLDL